MSPKPPIKSPDLFTVLEAAAIMRVSKMTVYRLIHAYELDALRIGRSIRIRRDDLAAYLGEAEIGREW